MAGDSMCEQAGEGGAAITAGFVRICAAQFDGSQQQLAQGGFCGRTDRKSTPVRKRPDLPAGSSSPASYKDQGLVKVDESRPQLILFRNEKPAGFIENRQRVAIVPLLAGGDGGEGGRFGLPHISY